VNEPTLSRDHTENMLKAFGADVMVKPQGEGQKVSVKGPVTLKATDVNVPGDPSSAAFPIVAALTTPGSDIMIENVMMNPTRTGLFETLTEMGAYLRADNFRTSGGEVIADIHVKHSKLYGVTVPENRAPSMIDEYPILAIAAAYASGTTIMRGIAEMRVKESDRISATDGMTVIAIDGTFASGKGTLGKRLAAHYGLSYLDTGKLYRAAAYAVMQAGDDPENANHAAQAAKALTGQELDNPILKSGEVAVNASKVAVHPGRHTELTGYGEEITFEAVLAQLVERDNRDKNRKESPLKAANDAHLIETSELGIDEVFNIAVRITDGVLGQ